MSEQSPAELLREAATRMRQSAEAVIAEDLHHGRWWVREFGMPAGCPFYVQGDESHLILAQFLRHREAAYVAGMDPATALAIADWLDDAADARETTEATAKSVGVDASMIDGRTPVALTAARTYLRREPVEVASR
jgi:hypothetical protein